MADKLIRNCKFKTQCEQRWEVMKLTDDEDVRFCEQCQESVHLCLDDDELGYAMQKNWCVAIFRSDDEDAIAMVGEVVSMYTPTKKILDWDT